MADNEKKKTSHYNTEVMKLLHWSHMNKLQASRTGQHDRVYEFDAALSAFRTTNVYTGTFTSCLDDCIEDSAHMFSKPKEGVNDAVHFNWHSTKTMNVFIHMHSVKKKKVLKLIFEESLLKGNLLIETYLVAIPLACNVW